ncbi:MAG: cyclase family protein [Chloroflexi bacterium]|nr:cyclase family protein [Anaerolineaceae bacterium]NMB88895.1 cyclase family protein [Chloroflexota bacterium]
MTVQPVIDISHPLKPGLPVHPGLLGFSLDETRRIAKGDHVNVSQIHMAVHTGTHLDTPFHYLNDGYTTSGLDLGRLIGPAQVIAVDAPVILPEHLEKAGVSREILLVKTSLSAQAEMPEFFPEYPYFHADAARWLVEHGVRLLGVDTWNPDKYHDRAYPCHMTLLGAGTLILECLRLYQVEPGFYTLVALPLKVENAEASPVRAVLLPDGV